jgi:hypothetical protein
VVPLVPGGRELPVHALNAAGDGGRSRRSEPSVLPSRRGRELPVRAVAHFSHTDLERTGRVVTSSPLLNKVIKAAEYSQLANWMSLPTDCTQRERRGWLGDAQLSAEGVVRG